MAGANRTPTEEVKLKGDALSQLQEYIDRGFRVVCIAWDYAYLVRG